jgi:hypothetical protein
MHEFSRASIIPTFQTKKGFVL